MTALGRLHPAVVIRHQVVNQSARTIGAHINLIVLHDTESHDRDIDQDLQAIVNWFDNPDAQASAHVVVNDEGHSAICVDSWRKAWHVAHYNSAALGIEQIGFSDDSHSLWESRPLQLRETARWIARWSLMYGIPIEHGHVADGAVTVPGVVMHRELGVLGGNHNDPGTGYPFWEVLNMANECRKLLHSAW